MGDYFASQLSLMKPFNKMYVMLTSGGATENDTASPKVVQKLPVTSTVSCTPTILAQSSQYLFRVYCRSNMKQERGSGVSGYSMRINKKTDF